MADIKGKDNFEKMPQIDGVDIVPSGGTAGQVLSKVDATDYNLEWAAGGAGGGGDVTAATNIADNAIVRGDGGAKGLQESTWKIEDDGLLHNTSIARTGYALEVWNTQATAGGAGLHVRGGETDGDISMRLADADDTFTLMEVESDQGHITLGKTFAQTVIDNGQAYGVDNQHNDTALACDFNTEVGRYRMAGNPLYLALHNIWCDQVEFPTGTDWSVNNGAPASADSLNSALTVRRFDDTTAEAIGFMMGTPMQSREMHIVTACRAQASPGVASVAKMRLHFRAIMPNAAPSAWTTVALDDVAIPTNTTFQYTETENTLTGWGLTPQVAYQFQISRDATNVGDTLVGDLVLLGISVEFS